MGFLLLLLPFLFPTSSHASSVEHGEILIPQAKLDYNAVVDVIPLEGLRAAMTGVWQHGLSPKLYWTDRLEKIYQSGEVPRLKMKKQVNQSFVRLLKDVSIGVVDPENLTPDIKLKQKKFLSPAQLQTLVISTAQKADFLVDLMAPRNPLYSSLKKSLGKVYPACSNGQWAPLKTTKKVLKLGAKDPAVPSLKARLVFLGYPISTANDVYDQEVVQAVNDIQWNLRIKPDSKMHPTGRVWKFLNTPCLTRVRQLQADMEKIRWLPSQFEDRYIFINLAMSYFVLVDSTTTPAYVTSFRTINGRSERKSPTMTDKVVRVILNPFWVVPPTIFIEDKVTEIRDLPPHRIQSYFDSHNYEVWNRQFTRRLNPTSIDWWSFDDGLDASIYIRQRPNYWNALGVIKFELTNSFSVYLHDTNQRELFYEPERQLSSGCIRLEKPFELAEFLLKGTEWDRAKIESVTAKPGQLPSKDTKIKVPNPPAVYTAYLTSFMGSDGILRFAEDAYEQNRQILGNIKAL